MNDAFLSILANRIDTIVPIIGHEMFVYTKPDGTVESQQSYLVDCFVESGTLSVSASSDSRLITRMKTEGFHGLTLMYFNFTGSKPSNPEERGDFENYIEYYVEQAKDSIGLNPSALSYLKATAPNLILTISPFPIIEQDMRKCGLVYESIYYIPGQIGESFAGIDEIQGKKYVVHLFGGTQELSSSTGTPWASTERKLLCYLHSLHNQDISKSVLVKILAMKKFLVMGCALPEWLFQFLLYPLKGRHEAGGSLWLDNNGDSSLELLNERLSCYNCEVKNFDLLDRLTEKIEKKRMAKDVLAELDQCSSYDFFVSHRAEDTDLTRQIVKKLREYGGTVWVDYEHTADMAGDQWHSIIQALEHSRHLIPIISGNYILRYRSKTLQPGRDVESITEAAISYMYSGKANDPNSAPRSGAEKFVLPLLNKGERFVATMQVYGMDQDIEFEVSPRTLSIFCKKDQSPLPRQFDNKLHCYFWEDESSISAQVNSIHDETVWRSLAKEGRTMAEQGESIVDYLQK